MTEPAKSQTVDVPSQPLSALRAGAAMRVGWSVYIAGDALDPSPTALWTPAQRASGVFVRFVHLTAAEEEKAVNAAVMARSPGALGSYQMRAALYALADAGPAPESTTDAPYPPPETHDDWKFVAHLHKEKVFNDLGLAGRALCAQAWQTATSPSERAAAAAAASFRLEV